ncbi:hypothetical protein INR49_031159, partial [Caranx melampygus]
MECANTAVDMVSSSPLHALASRCLNLMDAAPTSLASIPGMDMGIPAMTKCCNQLDMCYDPAAPQISLRLQVPL